MTDTVFSDKAEKLLTTFGILGVSANLEIREGSYYLLLDGGELFTTGAQWEAAIGRTFEEFVGVYANKIITPISTTKLTDTKIEYNLGTVFDMLTKQYD